MARQWRALYILCLVLSTLGPAGAARSTSLDEEALNLDEEAEADAAAEAEAASPGCPPGLRQVGKANGTRCLYELPAGGIVALEAEESYLSNMGFGPGSSDPIVFMPSGGVMLVEEQFALEQAAAVADTKAVQSIVLELQAELVFQRWDADKDGHLTQDEVKHALQQQDPERFTDTVVDELVALIDKDSDGSITQGELLRFMIGYADVKATVQAGEVVTVHEGKKLHYKKVEDIMPVEFVAHHAVEHVVVEGLVHGLEMAAGAAASVSEVGAVMGAVAAGSAFVAEILLSPYVLVPQVIYSAWKFYSHLKHKTHHAKAFAKDLVMKSDCIIERLKSFEFQKLQVHSNLQTVFGFYGRGKLTSQIRRSNTALLRFFLVLAKVGKCLYPHGDRRWAKTNCAEAVYQPLLMYHEHRGTLHQALSLAISYGSYTDELLQTPIFGDWLPEALINRELEPNKTLSESWADGLRKAPLGARALTGMSLLATHRGYELTFMRLRRAFQVYMRSFARERSHFSLRAIKHPCRAVFVAIEHEEGEEGLCKDEQFLDGHGAKEHAISEAGACELAKNHSLYPQPSEEGGEKAGPAAPEAEG